MTIRRNVAVQGFVLLRDAKPRNDGADAPEYRQPTGTTSTATPTFCVPGPITTPSSGATSA